MAEDIILKIIGILCVIAISITALITNKDDENVATKVFIFVIVALAIIFIPWDKVFTILQNQINFS